MNTQRRSVCPQSVPVGLRISLFPLMLALMLIVGSSTAALAAESGTEFAKRVAGLEREAREAAIVDAVRSGNMPAWWRRFAISRSTSATSRHEEWRRPEPPPQASNADLTGVSAPDQWPQALPRRRSEISSGTPSSF